MHRRSGARLRLSPKRRSTRRVLSLTCTLVVLWATVTVMSAVAPARASAAAPHAIVPPNDPYANVPTVVPLNCDLFAVDDTTGCIYSTLLDIDYARSLEGVGPLVLPTNYLSLTPAEQLFVVFNLERTARGLPALVELDAGADGDALTGALGSADPPIAGSASFQPAGSIAAFEVGNALQADWEWMYTDGCYPYEGSADCAGVAPGAAGGWGHRNLILGDYGAAPVAGAAEATATSGSFPGVPIWTAEFGAAPGGAPNGDAAFLNSSVSYPSTAAPYVVDVSPSTAGPSSVVTIQGVYLTGASTVYFGSARCPAAPAVTSDVSASVVVPSCAAGGSGLQIVVGGSVSNSASFNPNGPVVAAAAGARPAPFVGMAAPPSGNGYWEVGSDGGVFTFGGIGFYGSMGAKHLNAPIVGMASTPNGGGYWLVGSDGGVFAFGDAGFYGSAGNLRLVQPVVGMAATADGGGYWLVAADGGVFAYGDARFQGSMGGHHLNRPVVGMAEDDATGGYWLVAADGGIFSFGAPFLGGTGDIALAKPVVGMEAAPSGTGYRLAAGDGGLFSFRLPFEGSLGSVHLDQPVVGMAAEGTTGYWMVAADGGLFAFGGAGFYGSEG